MRSKLRNMRKAKKLTSREVAKYAYISSRMYEYIEQGSRNPSLSVANRLEDLFGIPQRELLVLDDSNLKEDGRNDNSREVGKGDGVIVSHQ